MIHIPIVMTSNFNSDKSAIVEWYLCSIDMFLNFFTPSHFSLLIFVTIL